MWYKEQEMFKYQATLSIIDFMRERLDKYFTKFSCLPTFAIMWRSFAAIVAMLVWISKVKDIAVDESFLIPPSSLKGQKPLTE